MSRWLFLLFGALGAWAQSSGTQVSEPESQFRNNHTFITLGMDDQFEPFNFRNEHGRLQGFNVDLIHLVENKLGMKIELAARPWPEIFPLAMEHRIDGIVNADSSPERASRLLFTQPLAHHPMALFTRKTSPYRELSDMNGKRVAVKKNTSIASYVKKQYPQWILVPTTSHNQSLLMLSAGDVEGTIDWYTVLRHESEQMMLDNLHAAHLFQTDEVGRSRIAIRNDYPELVTLLDKAIASITYPERQALYRKWMGDINYPSPDQYNLQIRFTPEEQDYLATHPSLVFSASEWAPISFTAPTGAFSGLVAEYLSLITRSTGITFVYEPSTTWSSVLQKYSNGEIDAIPTLVDPGNTGRDILVSDGFLEFPLVLATQESSPYIDKLSRLENQVVAVRAKGDAEPLLQTHYPKIKRIQCSSLPECLDMVSSGRAIAFMGHMAVIAQELRKAENSHLKIGGTTEFTAQHHIGVDPRYPQALAVINKALRAIPLEQRQALYDRWVTVRFDKEVDYSLFWKVLVGAGVLLLLAGGWIRYQHKMNKRLSDAIATAERAKNLASELEFYFQESTEMLCLSDLNGNFLRLNPQWERTLGYPIASLEGKPYLELVHPDDRQATQESMSVLAEKKAVFDFVNRYRDTSGNYRYLEWRAIPTSEDKVVATARDITELLSSQQEKELLFKKVQQKNDELERFSYTVSHDLRAPLVTIQGFASEILVDLQTQDFASVKDSVERILQASQRMNLLMQGLLQIARLGKEVAPFQTVNFSMVVQEVQELLHGSLQTNQVDLQIVHPLPIIHGDPLRLRELIQNLCENAIKYAHPSRSPVIQISSSDVGSFYVIHVADNGQGIPPEKHEAVFELFNQLDKKHGGVGVGLSLVKRIAELHGGTVKIRNLPDVPGATFDIYLPKPSPTNTSPQ